MDSGVGFSVSVVTSPIKSEIFRHYARPQSAHLARCVCVGRFPFGSAHPPWQLSRKDYANGLDVRLNAMVVANPIQSCLPLFRSQWHLSCNREHRRIHDRVDVGWYHRAMGFCHGARPVSPRPCRPRGLHRVRGHSCKTPTRMCFSMCPDPNCISPYSLQVPFSLMANMTSVSG
jgi:hypothetical protein